MILCSGARPNPAPSVPCAILCTWTYAAPSAAPGNAAHAARRVAGERGQGARTAARGARVECGLVCTRESGARAPARPPAPLTPRAPLLQPAARAQAGGGGGAGGGPGGPQSDALPEEGTIHRATVKRIEPYGVFVALDGFRRLGLVHFTQVDGRGRPRAGAGRSCASWDCVRARPVLERREQHVGLLEPRASLCGLGLPRRRCCAWRRQRRALAWLHCRHGVNVAAAVRCAHAVLRPHPLGSQNLIVAPAGVCLHGVWR